MTIVGKANSPKNIKKVHLDVHIADTREQQKTGKKRTQICWVHLSLKKNLLLTVGQAAT